MKLNILQKKIVKIQKPVFALSLTGILKDKTVDDKLITTIE